MTNPADNPWNPQDAALHQMWTEGLTTAEIGRRLNRSKSAVIGRARRLGLPGRAHPIPGRVTAAERLPYQPRPKQLDLVEHIKRLPAPKPQPQPILSSTRTCQFIAGNGRPWTICDAPSLAGSSWCPKHHAICVERVAPPMRDPEIARKAQRARLENSRLAHAQQVARS